MITTVCFGIALGATLYAIGRLTSELKDLRDLVDTLADRIEAAERSLHNGHM